MPRLNAPDLDLDKLYEISIDAPQQIKLASSGRLKFAENQKRFSNIGFDLFRDSESEFIWKLEKDADSGEEYIMRTASIDPAYKQANNWQAYVDSNKSAITLVYKGQAIKAFKKASLQFGEENVEDWRRYLIDKISSDPSFLSEVLAQVGENRRRLILAQFPELGK